MSFILDALKKAEREHSRVPTLATVHGPTHETRRTVSLWVAGGALLAGSGLLIWLLWPSPNVAPLPATDFRARVSATPPVGKTNSKRKDPSTEPGDRLPPASVARVPRRPDTGWEREGPRQTGREPLVNPRSIHAPPPQSSVPGGLPGAAGTATSSEQGQVETKPILPRRAEAPPVEGGPPAPRPAEPSVPPQAEPSSGGDRARADVVTPSPPSLPAKPPTLREAMAKMTLDVFVYTAVKADRMVVINGRRYVEGQYIDGLYLLEDITSEGVVLSYQGERALLRP